MTTHDQNIEATPSPEEVGPATARTEHRDGARSVVHGCRGALDRADRIDRLGG